MRNRSALICIAALLIGQGLALACTIPVFRYALDRWTPDSLVLEVPQAILESPAADALTNSLRRIHANLTLRAGDVPADKARLLLPGKQDLELWAGEFAPKAILALTSSPGRDQVAEALLAGEAAVWVIVPGTDAEVNAAFERTLRTRLGFLAQVAEIPEQDPSDPESQLGPGPELRVGFKAVTVSRKDPSEEVFLRMLAGQNTDLLKNSEMPFAAVVFGRGRVLGTWAATDLDDEGIDEVSLFLLGACSCRVKAQNPGWDLLMNVDWNARLMRAAMDLDSAREKAEGE